MIFLDKAGVSKEHVCLVGSSVLADYGLRANLDIDIVIDPFERGKIGREGSPDEIDILIERYSWLGVTDQDLVRNERYHYRSQGFKIIRPEVEFSFKQRRLCHRDRKDIRLLEDRFLGADDYEWDWTLFSYEYYPEGFSKRGLPRSLHCSPRPIQRSLIARFERKLRQEGLANALRATMSFMDRNLVPFGPFLPTIENSTRSTAASDLKLYFIVWPTALEFFDPIVARLDTKLGVISTECLDLTGEICQFVKDIYDYNDQDFMIEYKSYKIKNDGSEVRIIKTRCPSASSSEPNVSFLPGFKNQIRKEYYPYVSKGSFHNILHGPDTVDENEWMKETILSYTKKWNLTGE